MVYVFLCGKTWRPRYYLVVRPMCSEVMTDDSGLWMWCARLFGRNLFMPDGKAGQISLD